MSDGEAPPFWRLEEPSNDPSTVPILMGHGAWHGKWCYEKYFRDYFREEGFTNVHLMELPHHGEDFTTMRKLQWKSIHNYVDAVASTIQEIKSSSSEEEGVILVGHSMGGGVVQKYLERSESLSDIKAVILLGSMSPIGARRVVWRLLCTTPVCRTVQATATLRLYPIIGRPDLARACFFSKEMAEEEVQEYFEKLHDESLRALLDILILNRPKPKRVLKTWNIKVPMLVLGADQDVIFGPKEVKEIVKAYHVPSKHCRIFPNMAHDMMLEADWKDVADAMMEYIRTISSSNDGNK